MKVRILIVDETAFVRDALKRALRRFLKDVEVFDAVNGHRALAALRANKINIIISEWEMEEMSGHELLQWTRGSEQFQKTPFMVMSDDGNRQLVMDAINAGASDFLAKPFTPDEVQKKVVKQLARIGYKPKGLAANANQNTGFGSVDVLTGGAASAKPSVMKPREIQSATGFAKPKSAAPKKTSTSGNFSGTAHLHFDGYSTKCCVSELSLTGLNGTIPRSDQRELPRIFDVIAMDIENAQGEAIGKLNGYVYGLQSADPNPSASSIAIKLRFSDNAPEEFEQLSKAIARGR